MAEEGGYVYEPPGETHTLVVLSKITMCRIHDQACGLGADYLDRFIR